MPVTRAMVNGSLTGWESASALGPLTEVSPASTVADGVQPDLRVAAETGA